MEPAASTPMPGPGPGPGSGQTQAQAQAQAQAQGQAATATSSSFDREDQVKLEKEADTDSAGIDKRQTMKIDKYKSSAGGWKNPFKQIVKEKKEKQKDPEVEKQEQADIAFKKLQKIFIGAINALDEDVVKKALVKYAPLIEGGYLNMNKPITNTMSTFLHTAAWYRKISLVQWLLANGADPNKMTVKGNTPLHFACENGDKPFAKEAIALLINAGGKIDVKNIERQTPLDKAAASMALKDFVVECAQAADSGKIKDSVALLREWKQSQEQASQEAQNKAAADKLLKQQEEEQRKDPRLLMKAEQAFVRLKGIFMKAKMTIDEAAVRDVLIENSDLIDGGYLDLNRAITNTNSTFLHTAVWYRKLQLVRFLLDHGADPNVANLKGNTPCHLACENMFKEDGEATVSLLLAAGGNLNLRNVAGKTCLDMTPDPKFRQQLLNWVPTQQPAQADKIGTTATAGDAVQWPDSAPLPQAARAIAQRLAENAKGRGDRSGASTARGDGGDTNPAASVQGGLSAALSGMLAAAVNTAAIAAGSNQVVPLVTGNNSSISSASNNGALTSGNRSSVLALVEEDANRPTVEISQARRVQINTLVNEAQEAASATELHIERQKIIDDQALARKLAGGRQTKEAKKIDNALKEAEAQALSFQQDQLNRKQQAEAELAAKLANKNKPAISSSLQQELQTLAAQQASVSTTINREKQDQDAMVIAKLRRGNKNKTSARAEQAANLASKMIESVTKEADKVQAKVDDERIKQQQEVLRKIELKQKKAMQARQAALPRAGEMDTLFDYLDVTASGTLTLQSVMNFHIACHGCVIERSLVEMVMKTVGDANKQNFLNLTQQLHLACIRNDRLLWDFKCMDDLRTGHLAADRSETLWNYNKPLSAKALGFKEFQVKRQKDRPVDFMLWDEFQYGLIIGPLK